MDRIKITIVKDAFEHDLSNSFFIGYEGKTISEIQKKYIVDQEKYTIGVNGKVIPFEEWGIIIPKRGQHLTFVPTYDFAGASIGTLIWSFVVSALISAAITVVTHLLTDYPSTDEAPTGSTTQTYSWQTQTLQQQGPCIPKTYGTITNQGNIIDAYLENFGAYQYLNVLLCLGLGPYESLTDFEINDQPIAYYPGTIIDYRLGMLNQTPIANFNDIKIETITTHAIVKPLTWTANAKKYAESSSRTADMVVPTVANERIYKVASVEGKHAPVYSNTAATYECPLLTVGLLICPCNKTSSASHSSLP